MNLLNHWLIRLEKIEERMDGADPVHTWHLRMKKRILTLVLFDLVVVALIGYILFLAMR